MIQCALQLMNAPHLRSDTRNAAHVDATALRQIGRQFAERLFVLRVIGLGAGFFCVAAVFYTNGVSPLLWIMLVAQAFMWPHVARDLALASAAPRAAEMRNLILDSAFGGAWVALMHFNLLPCVLVVVMLAIDKLSVGGPKLLGRALVAQACACIVTAVATDFAFDPQTTMFEIYGSLPLLIAYPLGVSGATYQLARTVAYKNRLLAQLTRIDRLTGVLNRGTWEDAATAEVKRHQRTGAPAALLMIDIDHFKLINDAHGHQAGDVVIRNVAAVIQRCVRDVDLHGRYGGDEFSVILVNTDANGARRVADRIRLTILADRPDDMPATATTVSIGIATDVSDILDVQAWIKQADIALFKAKARGRDCVATHP